MMNNCVFERLNNFCMARTDVNVLSNCFGDEKAFVESMNKREQVKWKWLNWTMNGTYTMHWRTHFNHKISDFFFYSKKNMKMMNIFQKQIEIERNEAFSRGHTNGFLEERSISGLWCQKMHHSFPYTTPQSFSQVLFYTNSNQSIRCRLHWFPRKEQITSKTILFKCRSERTSLTLIVFHIVATEIMAE